MSDPEGSENPQRHERQQELFNLVQETVKTKQDAEDLLKCAVSAFISARERIPAPDVYNDVLKVIEKSSGSKNPFETPKKARPETKTQQVSDSADDEELPPLKTKVGSTRASKIKYIPSHDDSKVISNKKSSIDFLNSGVAEDLQTGLPNITKEGHTIRESEKKKKRKADALDERTDETSPLKGRFKTAGKKGVKGSEKERPADAFRGAGNTQ